MSPGWFHVRPVARGVWLLAEPSHVNSWLVAGDDRAVLVDSGLGIVPIRPVVETLCALPVDVVNTHRHLDHVGGNGEFPRVSAFPSATTTGVDRAERASYLSWMREVLAAAAAYRPLDDRYFHLLSADSDPRPLPDGIERWVDPGPPSGPEPSPLRDGDVVELGGRTLTVLHTPGHSPDSICLLDDRDGVLFAGDTVNTGPVYAQAAECDLAAFARSTARLAALASDVSLVAMAHFGRGVAEPAYLHEIASAFHRLASGDPTVSYRPARDCEGDEVREAVFDACSVYLPVVE
ncbi:MBL fold metallo-hydrolase [Actinomycetospora sp. OC33-EN08]|uniref:MBL fold metallo-hydrolase n=1 Tax=Actinomycetospora aurantiaca TaxID=3129233 RepID=A0ABU8MSQ5_9PSEU